jgi:exonuclease SbcD
VDRKIERWAEHANVDAAPLVERFQLLESGFVEAIAAAVLAGLEAEPDTVSESGPSTDLPATDVQAVPANTMDDLAMPVATVEVTPAAQKSWLDDDLFAA